jgi:hypothetical protein
MGPRNSVAEVLHFIQDEMAEAAAVLPAVYPDEDNGRATKGAALGYQLKALVFESSYAQLAGTDKDPANYFEGCTQKWGQAMTVFNQLEALGVYHLEPDYADIWPVDHEKGPELIWTGHSVSRDAGGGIEDINRQIIGGVQCVYQACRSYYDEDGVLIPNGRSGLYGLNAPTYELRDEFETGDPRRDISFVEEYDPLILSIDGVLDTLPAAPSFASPTSMNNAKYDPLPWEWISSVLHYGPRDIKFMRYADVLLLAAEAALNNNDAGTALTLVNRVRTRARNSGTTAAPADLSSVTMADIQHERRCELALEAHRYFDIVRWGIADDVLSGQYRQTDLMTNPDAAPLDWIPGKHEFFPIPESEIALNQGQMAQNPGY